MQAMEVLSEIALDNSICNVQVQASWRLTKQADLDISCILYGKMGNLLDCAYYNNKVVQEGSVIHHGDSKVDVEGVDEAVSVNLSRLNLGVKALVFVINCTKQSDFSAVEALTLSFACAENNTKLVIEDPDCVSNHKGLIMCILHRPDDLNPTLWKLVPIKRKTDKGHNFLEVVPDVRDALRDYNIVDAVLLEEGATLGKKSFDLSKGEFFDLIDCSSISFCLGWDAGCDLDASVAYFDKDNACLDTPVYFSNTLALNGAIVHNGDNVTGEGEGDDEVIDIKLNSLPSKVYSLVALINVFSGGSFRNVKNAFVRIVDRGTKRQICRYMLTDADLNATAYIMCRVYRHQGIDGESLWRVKAMGDSATGRSCRETIETFYRTEYTKIVVRQIAHHNIYISEGRNLIAKDKNGTSDPYFVVKINGEKKRRCDSVKKTLNPKWTYPRFEEKECSMTVEVWDKDLLIDDFMGCVHIPLPNAPYNIDQWFELQKRTNKDEVSGEVHINIETVMIDDLKDVTLKHFLLDW
ncbi:hypothetical protein AKO1_008051 [Acrasis kona]|uniref:C2 domain-containing protein n=1 Tax=Acrasis kona TaxID=1008807 RepID=A0AAW2YQ19_9EUKA